METDWRITMKPFSKYFDHTNLKPEATEKEIETLCDEAKRYEFYAVCVNSCYVADAAKYLKDSDVKVASVVGFPLGASTTATKVFETEESCKAGASEIDMVLNVGKFKSGNYDYCKNDIEQVVKKAAEYGAIVKVILETCLLEDDEVVKASQLAEEAGAHFIKTSTGFGSGGAKPFHIKLMKNAVSDDVQIKASGGIKNFHDAMALVEAGADRIGASSSVAILKESERRGKLYDENVEEEEKEAEEAKEKKDK